MIRIKKYINENDFEIIYCDNLAQFMLDNIEDFKLGYRFYSGCVAETTDITEDAEALSKSDSLIMLKPAYGDPFSIIVGVVAAAIVGATAVKLLTPKVEAPSTSNRTQNSATNALGSRENGVRIGERIDDCWGKVTNFVPSLIQVPHARFEDNTEQEHFAMACFGKGLIEDVQDGDTKFRNLIGGKFNAWNPGGNPNDGTSPDVVIGSNINRPLVNVEQSSELQSAELLPPNDNSLGGDAIWRITSSGGTGLFVLENRQDLGIVCGDYFTVGEDLRVINATVLIANTLQTLYKANGNTNDFVIPTNVENISGVYTITNVTDDSVAVDISQESWQTFTGKYLITDYYTFEYSSSGLSSSTTDSLITDGTWYETYPTGGPASDPIENVSDISFSPSVGQAFNQFVGPIEVPADADTMVLNFVADSGFYKIDQTTEKDVTATLQLTYEYFDANGDLSGTIVTEDVTFQSNQTNRTQQAAITHDSGIPVGLYGGQLLVRRTTDRDKGDSITNVDKVFWRDLFFYSDIATPDYGNVTTMQVVIPSSITARSVKERQLNITWTRYITPYIGNGQFGAESPVETWAEVVIALALDEYNGRLTLDEIDADLLLEVQQQMIDYYGTSDYVKVGYNLDSTKLRFQDSFKLFCTAVNARAYSQGAVYKAYPDIKREVSTKQFTHRNKIPDTDARENNYETDYDGIEVKYRDNDTGTYETIIRHVNGIDSNNRQSLELSGATNVKTATIRADRELNILKYQRTSCNFDADGIALLTVPGERVDNVDDTRIVKRDENLNTYQIYSGSVVSQNGLTIQLSEPVYFEDGETHSIRFTNSKGELLEAITCTAGSTPYHVVLTQSPSESIYTGYKRERTTYTMASDVSRLALPVIIRGIQAKERSGFKIRQLSCINFDERYYQDDQQFSEN